MKTFPIPSKPPQDDRDRPKVRDTDQGDDTATSEAYAKGGKVHGDEAEDRALFSKLMSQHEKGEGKGASSMERGYAKGGAVLGRTREFMKEPDPFSAGSVGGAAADAGFIKTRSTPGSPQDYDKGGKKHPGKDKTLKTVTPRQ